MSSESNLINRETMERNNESFLELYKALHRPSNISMEEEPPSYEAAMEQEKDRQELIGKFLLKASHFFGMHPFKAPIVCRNDFCQERGFRDRICVPDLILCIINLLVILNHLYLHVWKEQYPAIFLNKSLEMILHILESALPLVCVSGMMFCSYHMHNLLQRLTDAQFRIIQKKCMAKVYTIRLVLYFVVTFFIIGALLELPQNFMIEVQTMPFNTTNINVMPLNKMPSWWFTFSIFIDRYYFPIMNFGVVKVPQLFIMMISIRVALMFRINATILSKALARTKAFPIRETLENYFGQLLDIVKILNMFEHCFNKLMLAIVTTSVIKVIFTGYATIRELLYSEKFENIGMKSIFLDDNPEFKNQDGYLPFLTTLNSICSVFSVILNASWTVIFLIPCIYCNEFSRSSLPVITSKLVCDDAKNIKDQIVQKLMDPSWGLTLGKLIVVDRTFAMTLVSLICSIIAVWLQFPSTKDD